MALSPDALWEQRLLTLREMYSVGLHILADAQNPSPPQMSDRWDALSIIWERYAEEEVQLRTQELPDNVELRQTLQTQAQANAALYRSLEAHGRGLQETIRNLLPHLRVAREFYATPEPTQTLHLKA